MEVTEQTLADWKKQYGEISIVEVKIAADDTAVAYLKPADRNVLARALQQVAKDQLIEPGETILNGCWLGGDERLKLTSGYADTRPQQAAATAAVWLVKMMEATVKKI